MIVHSDKSFLKDITKLTDEKIKSQIRVVIDDLREAENIMSIANIKKLSGYKNFYRIRVGNYRIGFELNSPDEIILIRFLHRKDIYQKWP